MNRSKVRKKAKQRAQVVSVTKNGRVYNVLVSPGAHAVFQFESLAAAGWIRVTTCGVENVYFEFTDDAGATHAGYCKCL